MKCFGQGYHRDEKLASVDRLIERSRKMVLQREKELQAAKKAIGDVNATIKLLLKDLKENETEKIALLQLHETLLNGLAETEAKEMAEVSKLEIIERLEVNFPPLMDL